MGPRSRRAWAGWPEAEPSTTEILILATAESRWQAWQNDDGRRTASALRVRPRRRETRPLREAGFRKIDPGGHTETRVLGRTRVPRHVAGDQRPFSSTRSTVPLAAWMG